MCNFFCYHCSREFNSAEEYKYHLANVVRRLSGSDSDDVLHSLFDQIEDDD